LTHRVFWQIATGMTPANLGRTLALSLFLGLGCGGISFAEQPTEHWLIGLWQEKDSGAVVMISGVEPDGTALGTIGPTEAVQVKTETKVDGPRVRIVSESGTVIEAARTLVAAGDLIHEGGRFRFRLSPPTVDGSVPLERLLADLSARFPGPGSFAVPDTAATAATRSSSFSKGAHAKRPATSAARARSRS